MSLFSKKPKSIADFEKEIEKLRQKKKLSARNSERLEEYEKQLSTLKTAEEAAQKKKARQKRIAIGSIAASLALVTCIIIDIEFAHVAPDTLKTLDQLTICHEIHLLQFMASFYHRRCPNERTAPCQLRSGMGLNQFFADF